jgi:SAM-dependent methyltransferase
MANCCFYEQESVRQVLGETLRPGGLALTERALAFCSLPAGVSLLDVGCGLGTTVHYLRDHGYCASGIDLSPLLLQAGRRRYVASPLLQARGERLPLGTERFAAVIAECTLSVLADAGAALAEFHRLLSWGGYLVISDIYARNPDGLPRLRELPLTSCLRGAKSQAEVTAMVINHGFKLVLWEDHSEFLRRLAGPGAIALGSPAQFWGGAAGGGLYALDNQLAISKARTGYFLLIAKKQ